MSGTVVLVHTDDDESDASGLGRISTRIWVVRESDKEKVIITPSFDNSTHVFRLQVIPFTPLVEIGGRRQPSKVHLLTLNLHHHRLGA